MNQLIQDYRVAAGVVLMSALAVEATAQYFGVSSPISSLPYPLQYSLHRSFTVAFSIIGSTRILLPADNFGQKISCNFWQLNRPDTLSLPQAANLLKNPEFPHIS